MAMPTLLDVVKLNGANSAAGLIDEASRAVPEVRLGVARTILGLNYKTLVRTGVPTINFRGVNEGTAIARGVYEQRLVEAYLMNPPFQVDAAAADAYEDGRAAYIALEGLAITEGAMQALGRGFFYGQDTTVGKGANCFPGLMDAYDSTNMVVDAAGTTASTASSVWLVRWGELDVEWVLGEGGRTTLGPVREQQLYDSDGNPYDGLVSSLYMRPGLQVGRIQSVCRIKKLTADSGCTLTDALLDAALAKFPAGRPPNAIYGTRRSWTQLKASRTAYSPSGAPADWPTSIEGPEGTIPIYTTESLLNTEALTL